MRKSRFFFFAQRLNELASQLSELADLRVRVERAERRAHHAPSLRSTRPASRRLRSLETGAHSVRLRRYAPPSRNARALGSPENDNQVDWLLLNPFPDGWWASP